MKFATVTDAFLALLNKVVVFNSLTNEYECDADIGMKGRVKQVLNDHDHYKVVIDLKEFENHNDPLMLPTYYDKEGCPCLNMKEAGFYNGEERIYVEFGADLPFNLAPEETMTDEEIRTNALARLSNAEKRVLGLL